MRVEKEAKMQKILYVEDSPEARRLVQRLLSDRYSILGRKTD